MTKAQPFQTHADYFAAQPAAARTTLAKVRATICKAVPAASEAMSYNMPALKLDGRVLLYFAGWKDHYAIYPANPEAFQILKRALAGYAVSKGTIRFAWSEPVPIKLISAIARLRADQILAQRRKP